jgi:DNA polymerase III subunit epsilon
MPVMLLFFDTETSGLPDYNLPVDDETQPHLVQFAAQLCEPDGKLRATVSLIVNPDCWDIPQEASAVHGITKEIAMRSGQDLPTVCRVFKNLTAQSHTLVAHNLDFDEWVMATATSRAGIVNPFLTDKKRICTQKASTPILNLPPTHAMLSGGRHGAEGSKSAGMR